MTNHPIENDPDDMRHDDRQGGGPHTCYNCFAEFDWEPTVRDGEDYCCPGCVEGGPCVCLYDESPQRAEDDLPEPVAVDSESGQTPVVLPELPELRETGGGANSASRRQVLLQAIDELPDRLQRVARLRVASAAPLGEIARDVELLAPEAEQALQQAQVIIARTLGPEFVIEYIPEETRQSFVTALPGTGPADPRLDSSPSAVPVPSEESEPPAAPTTAAGAGADLSEAIRAPLEALTAPLLGAQGDTADVAVAQKTIREALSDASAIFRLAAERLGEDADEHPLRRLLADETTDEVRIVADGLTEPARYLAALDGLGSTKWARVESKEDDRTIFAVEVGSSSALVRDVMGLKPPFRPTRLVVYENELQIALPPEASVVGHAAGGLAELKKAPVFELGADAFFGARHFVTMSGVQGPPHHHSYRVEALMETSKQDRDGVVIGFGEARKLVEDIVAGYNETLLNTVEPFTEMQPTSENLAKVIFDRMKLQMGDAQIRLKQVRVWESPTNSASYSDAALAI